MALVFRKGLLRHFFLLIFSVSIVSFLLFTLYEIAQHSTVQNVESVRMKRQLFTGLDTKNVQKGESLTRYVEESKEKLDSRVNVKKTIKEDKNSSVFLFKNVTVNFNVHIFYYPWYQNEKIDGKYTHWNHEVIPDWHKPSTHRKRQYVPPEDIGANFYPKLGPYSSHDPEVIETHMQQIKSMGIGVICVSWYPPQYLKAAEIQVDDGMMAIFDKAAKYGLKVTFHIEPYKNRSGETLLEVSKFIMDKYGSHPAFYHTTIGGRNLPVYYVYDSYQISELSWAEALKPSGLHSIRNTKYNAIFLGLLVEQKHFNHLTTSGFDGFYTYFATNGFTYGSSWINWHEIAKESKRRNLIFVPSIGPGYLDTRVRPWNSKNARLRLKGKYYRKSFYNALSVKPHFLSITSFNEWHEGTQVEPAIPKSSQGFKYVDYLPNSPEFYLNLTQQFVKEYTRNMSRINVHEHDDAF